MENLSAADVAAVSRQPYNDGFGFGGGSGIWLFAILALMWGGNGMFGNRGAGLLERCATVEDINNSTNFARLESQVQGGFGGINERLTSLGNGICSLGYDIADKFGETNTNLANCCCGINRNIDGVRYENALNTASINANTTAQIQKVLDRLCEDKTQAMQNQINKLELREAMCGVVRYPLQTTYTAGHPFNYGNCGC